MDNSTDIRIGSSRIKRSAHACAFFNSREEYYKVLTPFIKDGMEANEMAFHILNEADHVDHVERLEKSGVEASKAIKSEQFIMKDWNESYLKPGHFDQEDMLALLENVLKEGKAKGFSKARLIGDMDWAANQKVNGVKDVVEYESRLNRFLPHYDEVVVVCTYDLNKHSASVIMDVLRSHPFVLIGGMMHVNPYYVSPDELISELSERK